MSKALTLLFPWRRTFRRLHLENRWWHRLAVVLFFAALVPLSLASWFVGFDASGPSNTTEHAIDYWDILPPPPDGFLPIQNEVPTTASPDPSSYSDQKIALLSLVAAVGAAHVDSKDQRKTIEMPDGKTATFPGTTPDESIKAQWNRKLRLAQTEAALFGFGIAVLAGAVFSYILQASYRAVLYVVYGAKIGATPDSSVSG